MKIEIDLEDIAKNGLELDSPLLGVLIPEKYKWIAKHPTEGTAAVFVNEPIRCEVRNTWQVRVDDNLYTNLDLNIKGSNKLTKINRPRLTKYKEFGEDNYVEAAKYLGKEVEFWHGREWIAAVLCTIQVGGFIYETYKSGCGIFKLRQDVIYTNRIRVKIDD